MNKNKIKLKFVIQNNLKEKSNMAMTRKNNVISPRKNLVQSTSFQNELNLINKNFTSKYQDTNNNNSYDTDSDNNNNNIGSTSGNINHNNKNLADNTDNSDTSNLNDSVNHAVNLFKRRAQSKKIDLENGATTKDEDEQSYQSSFSLSTTMTIRHQLDVVDTNNTSNDSSTRRKPLGLKPTGLIFQELTRLHTDAKKKSLKTKMHERLYEKQQYNKDENHILDKISRYVFPGSFLLFNLVFVLSVFLQGEKDDEFSQDFLKPVTIQVNHIN